jgi:hypothetical protein
VHDVPSSFDPTPITLILNNILCNAASFLSPQPHCRCLLIAMAASVLVDRDGSVGAIDPSAVDTTH